MKGNMYIKMVESLFMKGDKSRYSHLIIVVDKEDMEYVKIFVKREENIKDVLYNIITCQNYQIKEIYNYDMNLSEQIAEDRAYHITATYNKMEEAYKFAREKHKGQIRLNGTSYIEHPCKVAEIITNYFKDYLNVNSLLIAAYLHDTLEDTNTTIDEIKDKFGDYVLNLVKGVTNDEKKIKIMGKTDYLCNKMLNMEDDVLNLKLCDRLANVLDLKNAPDDFVNKYEIETIVILSYLVSNRKLNSVQLEIIKEINDNINKLRREKVLKLVNNINN